MECVFCKDEHAEPLALVYRPENLQQVQSCIPCAIKQGIWCARHDQAHVGLHPSGTVCLECVDDDLEQYRDHASGILIRLMGTLPYAEWKRVVEWTIDMAGAWEMEPNVVTLRGVLMEARRRGVPHTQIVDEVCAVRSVDAILPHAY